MRHIKVKNLNIVYTEKGETHQDVINKFNLNKIILPNQIHSDIVCSAFEENLTCDALFTDKKETAIGVKTADCVPVVLTDFRRVAVVHAGWRGIVSGILENTLKIFDKVEFAYIAPSIRKCCYEVGEDFYENLKQDFLQYFYKKEEKLYFALQEAVVDKLKPFCTEVIENHRCTSCDDKLYSYRKGDKKNRIFTVVWIE